MLIKEDKYFIYDNPKAFGLKYIIKLILSSIYSLYYNIAFHFIRIKPINKKYDVSICAIYKNESCYLKEWIEYHILIGVDHFYLYNNNSSDDYLNVLQEYIDKNIVTLIDWEKPQSQMEAYQNCVNSYSNETNWFCFIDIDEFIVPNKDNNINDFLKEFCNKPILIVYWKCFGASGIYKRNSNRLVTEDFVLSWGKYTNIGKVFYNTAFSYDIEIFKGSNMHYMWARKGKMKLPPVNVFNKVCIYNNDHANSKDFPIQINHYVTKSLEEYINKKMKRGGGVHPLGFHNNDYFTEHNERSVFPDYHIYKYLPYLKQKLDK